MDPNPNPLLQGKVRKVVSSIARDKDVSKGLKENKVASSRPRQGLKHVVTKPRSINMHSEKSIRKSQTLKIPKRVFGTIRSTNIPVKKTTQEHIPLKSCKPLKSSTISTKLFQGDKTSTKIGVAKPDGNVIKNSKYTDRNQIRKPSIATSIGSIATSRGSIATSRGSFPSREILKGSVPKDGPKTPINTNFAALGTPYLSAQDCSKCRFDKLESASYWINQINLAESVGKHFVSATFFRLAKECNAEPSSSLRSELRSYIQRHFVESNVWHDVWQLYGLMGDNYHTQVDGATGHAMNSVENAGLTYTSKKSLLEGVNGDTFLERLEDDSLENQDASPKPKENSGNEACESDTALVDRGTEMVSSTADISHVEYSADAPSDAISVSSCAESRSIDINAIEDDPSYLNSAKEERTSNISAEGLSEVVECSSSDIQTEDSR